MRNAPEPIGGAIEHYLESRARKPAAVHRLRQRARGIG